MNLTGPWFKYAFTAVINSSISLITPGVLKLLQKLSWTLIFFACNKSFNALSKINKDPDYDCLKYWKIPFPFQSIFDNNLRDWFLKRLLNFWKTLYISYLYPKLRWKNFGCNSLKRRNCVIKREVLTVAVLIFSEWPEL